MADQKRDNELNIFDWMDRYKVPILFVILIGMAFFGVIGFLLDLFRGESEQEKRMKEIVTSYEIGGETYEVTRADIRGYDIKDSKDAEALIGELIRKKLTDRVDPYVSEAEFQDALDEVKEFIRTANEGKFDAEVYTRFCNTYRMTPQQFEQQLREDMKVVKLMRELDRASGRVSSAEMIEQQQKENQKIKLTGIFWDPSRYGEKLARDDDEKLTAEAKAKVVEYFNGLGDDKKRNFHTGGAIVSVDYMGFDFQSYEADADLEAAFKAVGEGATDSLENLTADITLSEDDVAKMKLRYERSRREYGDDGESELDVEFEKRKPRLTIEWKILNHIKKVHDELVAMEKAGEVPDFAAVAKANNLIHGTWTDTKVQDIVSGDLFPGVYAYQLQSAKENTVFNWNTGVGQNTSSLFRGPVDEVAKHASIFRLLNKDLRPVANIEEEDVLERVAKDLESSTATVELEADVEAFEDKMNEFLENIEEVKTARKDAREQADKDLAEAIKDLDAEKDADEIAELKMTFDDQVESEVDSAREEHRSAAFDALMNDLPGKAFVVTEGFFDSRMSVRESDVDGDDFTGEQIARHLLRKRFNELHDQPFAEKFVDVGTVSEVKDLVRQRRGWRGIAKLVEKKSPTLEEIFSRPIQLRQAEQRVLMAANPGGAIKSMWDWDSMKESGFNIDTAKIESAIREEVDRKATDEQRLEEIKRQREAKKKAIEDAKREAAEKARRQALEADKAAKKLAGGDDADAANETDGAEKPADGEDG